MEVSTSYAREKPPCGELVIRSTHACLFYLTNLFLSVCLSIASSALLFAADPRALHLGAGLSLPMTAAPLPPPLPAILDFAPACDSSGGRGGTKVLLCLSASLPTELLVSATPLYVSTDCKHCGMHCIEALP